MNIIFFKSIDNQKIGWGRLQNILNQFRLEEKSYSYLKTLNSHTFQRPDFRISGLDLD